MDLPQSQTNAWRAIVRVLRSPRLRHGQAGQSLLHSVTSVLFPADCRVCGDPLCGYSRIPVCDPCWKNLSSQSGPVCSRCGESLGVSDFGEAGQECRPCRTSPPAFVRAVAHGPYSGTMRPLLHLLKYDGLEPIAATLGHAIARQLARHADLPLQPLVVPVPLFRVRQKQRGFNQSHLLASATVRSLRSLRPEWRGQLAARVLQRSRATQSQAGLSLPERRRNLRGAFFVPDAEVVRGRDVLLIDDIYTTGATARACSSVLKRAGAASVWVATVARAQRDDAVVRYRFSGAEGDPGAREELNMSRDVARWGETVH